jgi:hypothetical protein
MQIEPLAFIGRDDRHCEFCRAIELPADRSQMAR